MYLIDPETEARMRHRVRRELEPVFESAVSRLLDHHFHGRYHVTQFEFVRVKRVIERQVRSELDREVEQATQQRLADLEAILYRVYDGLLDMRSRHRAAP